MPADFPAKKQAWSPLEDAMVIALRGNKFTWDDISRRVQGRSSNACYIRYQRYLRKAKRNEEGDKIARRHKRTEPRDCFHERQMPNERKRRVDMNVLEQRDEDEREVRIQLENEILLAHERDTSKMLGSGQINPKSSYPL